MNTGYGGSINSGKYLRQKRFYSVAKAVTSSFKLNASSLVYKVNWGCSGRQLAAIIGIWKKHRRLKYILESHCVLDIVMDVPRLYRITKGTE